MTYASTALATARFPNLGFSLTENKHYIQDYLGSGILFGCVKRAYRLDLRPNQLAFSCGTTTSNAQFLSVIYLVEGATLPSANDAVVTSNAQFLSVNYLFGGVLNNTVILHSKIETALDLSFDRDQVDEAICPFRGSVNFFHLAPVLSEYIRKIIRILCDVHSSRDEK